MTTGARGSQPRRAGSGEAAGQCCHLILFKQNYLSINLTFFSCNVAPPCSDNLRYGVNFAKRFIDGPDKKGLKKTGELRNLMNLHNNKAGRMVSTAVQLSGSVQ